MEIGKKLKTLRLKNGLTLEELANRTELSKGFLSQLERDITTTSIHTLLDILDVLGTTAKEFFDDQDQDIKFVFCKDDCFEQDNDQFNLTWLVPNHQKNQMEPILLTLYPGQISNVVLPFEGQAFGYVLQGQAILSYGTDKKRIKKGNSFYFSGDKEHFIENDKDKNFVLLWVVSPPIF